MANPTWETSKDLRTYTGLTTARVYEINLIGTDQPTCVMQVRPRAVDPSLGHEWTDMGTFRNPATAMMIADHNEQEA